MHVTFYRSFLCPRCFMAGRHLREIAAEDPSIVIDEIDILQHPVKIWKEGIRCIPALRIEGETLSGIYLDRDKIRNFIRQFNITTS